MYGGLGSLIDTFVEERIDIKKYRELTKERKEKLYNINNIKVFLNKCQTLEYDLAMGELAYYLNNAIIKVKNDEKLEKQDFKEKYKNYTSEELAKEIFIKNFYTDYEENKKSSLSKANVALNLSYILRQNQEVVRKILLKDDYCRYLVEAIEHVTAPIERRE